MDIEKPSNIYSNLAAILTNKGKSQAKGTPKTKKKHLPSTTDSVFDGSFQDDTEVMKTPRCIALGATQASILIDFTAWTQ